MKDRKTSYQQGSAEKSKIGKRNTQDHEGRKEELLQQLHQVTRNAVVTGRESEQKWPRTYWRTNTKHREEFRNMQGQQETGWCGEEKSGGKEFAYLT